MTQWDNYRQSIRNHLANDSLGNFLQWSTIQATMFVGNAPYIRHEYNELLTEYPHYKTAIEESMVGNPTLWYDGQTSGNLIHQMYHIKQLANVKNINPKDMQRIVEIGGGYGAMCYIWRKLGFTGHYIIIDFPELSAIQQYFINRTGVEGWLTLCDSWRGDCDLLIASHSLGEMPIPERERLLSQVATKEYLFASSYEYEGVDNAAWFQQFAGSTVGADWKFYPHRWQENAFYQVGVRLSKL